MKRVIFSTRSFNTATKVIYVESEVLTAVVMKSSIFWDITPCSPVKVNPRFGGKYFHLQDRRISLLATCFHDGFLLNLFFQLEDGGDIFLRNVCWLSTNYKGVISQKTEPFKSIAAKKQE
jgi:hypothetical protein